MWFSFIFQQASVAADEDNTSILSLKGITLSIEVKAKLFNLILE